MSTRVIFSGNSQSIAKVGEKLAGILSGRLPDEANIARDFLLAIGFGALSSIKRAYIVKARGGTDEMGISWPPLSREYLAYGRRFGNGEQVRLKKLAGLGKQNSRAPGNKKGLLTAEQLKEWRKIYGTRLARFLVSLPPAEARARAAKIAWAEVKRKGAKTKLEVFGSRVVDILRDTGVLLNSLSPGINEGGQDRVFEVGKGSVIVGTNVPYAAVHQFGDTARGIPARPFLPRTGEDIPDAWWNAWLAVAVIALEAAAAELVRRMSR